MTKNKQEKNKTKKNVTNMVKCKWFSCTPRLREVVANTISRGEGTSSIGLPIHHHRVTYKLRTKGLHITKTYGKVTGKHLVETSL